VDLHAGAMQDQLLFVKMILRKEQGILDQVGTADALQERGIAREQLMGKEHQGVHHGSLSHAPQ
jgi:hypothetical protein